MAENPSLSLALQWILQDQRLTETELATMAGVSPGAVAAFLGRPHAPSQTWMVLLAALRCRLEIRAPSRTLAIAMPRISSGRRSHERQQWEARRLVAFRAQILRQSPGTTPQAAQATAASYVAASAARLAGDLLAAQRRLDEVAVAVAALGLRATVRLVAAAAGVNAEDLALLAGVSLSAAQSALDDQPDGKLATPHRLFSAMAARLVVLPAGGGAAEIALASPGEWRPEAPRTGQSSISHEEMRARAGRGESLASIARAAGVSRQRVHAIVRVDGDASAMP